MGARTLFLTVLALLALLAFAACGSDNGNGGTPADGTPGTTATPAASPSTREECPRLNDQIVQTLFAGVELDKDGYKQGEPVKITLRLVNCADAQITRSFPDTQRYDFSVRVAGGEELWRWSEGQEFQPEAADETLESAQVVTFTETWDQKDNEGKQVAAGEYEVGGGSTGCDQSFRNCGPRASRIVSRLARRFMA